jgi:hypothetical protein
MIKQPLFQVALAQRRLHLLDIENLVGAEPSETEGYVVRAVLQAYAELVGCQSDEHVIVGCNPSAAWVFAIHDVLPAASIRTRRGEHGGELAILDLVDALFVSRTYNALWIASGDRAFTGLAVDCRRRGVPVAVVTHPRALARSLAVAASVVLPFGCELDLPGAA